MLADWTPHETVADLRRVAEQVVALAVVGADETKTLVVPGDADARLARAALAAELAALALAAAAAGVARAGAARAAGRAARARARLVARGGLRSAIFVCCERLASRTLSSERLPPLSRLSRERLVCQTLSKRLAARAFRLRRQIIIASCNTLAFTQTLAGAKAQARARGASERGFASFCAASNAHKTQQPLLPPPRQAPEQGTEQTLRAWAARRPRARPTGP